jgi:hypothetical protein
LYLNGSAINARKANATDNTKPAYGFVKAAVTSPNSGSVTGLYEDNAYVSSLTIGSVYYLSTTGGAVTATAPSTAGNIVQQLGIASAATNLKAAPGPVVELS